MSKRLSEDSDHCESRFFAVVPAAGVGQRMAADRPKQYLELSGQCVIECTLQRLLDASIFTTITVAISNTDPYWPTLAIAANPTIRTAAGGKERSDSVLSALNQLSESADENDWVMVHDAARPCITVSDIALLAHQLVDDPIGGILALPMHDTLKQVDQAHISGTVDRQRIWRALTPQMFRYGALRSALQKAAENGEAITDEASALELRGSQPAIIEGRSDNIKITRPEDLALAHFFRQQQCIE